MKKIIVGILFGLVGFVSLAEARVGMNGSERPATWRSSFTVTADTNVLLASGSIHFHGVQDVFAVALSSIVFYDAQVFNANVTTKTIIDLGTNRDIFFDIPFSSGCIYRKFGTAAINILWDWNVAPLQGQETKGIQ